MSRFETWPQQDEYTYECINPGCPKELTLYGGETFFDAGWEQDEYGAVFCSEPCMRACLWCARRIPENSGGGGQ